MRGWWLIGLVAGCGFSPSATGVDDASRGPDAAHDGGTDAAHIDGSSSPAATCDTPGTVSDNFDDGSAATLWSVVTGGGSVAEQGGELIITPTAHASAGYLAKHYVDLRESSVQVDVTSVPSASDAITTVLGLNTDSSRALSMSVFEGQLLATIIDPVDSMKISVPYDPAKQRTWRVREHAGTLTMETSPDGAAWTTVATSPTPSGAAHVRIALATSGGQSGAGSASFDNLDIGEPGAICKASTVVDTFDRTVIGDDWLLSQRGTGGCALYVGSGAHADQNGKPDSCFFGASGAIDLVDSALTMTIPGITTTQSAWKALISLRGDDGGAVSMFLQNGMICAAGTNLASVCRTYTAAETVWQIKEASGMLTLSTSVDGTTFVPVTSLADPIALDALQISFGTSSSTDLTADPIPMLFSSYN